MLCNTLKAIILSNILHQMPQRTMCVIHPHPKSPLSTSWVLLQELLWLVASQPPYLAFVCRPSPFDMLCVHNLGSQRTCRDSQSLQSSLKILDPGRTCLLMMEMRWCLERCFTSRKINRRLWAFMASMPNTHFFLFHVSPTFPRAY